jgi:hypothetical protein
MSSDPEFSETVDKIIKQFEIQSIVETGAFHGLGSTMVFAKTGLPVVSIECSQENFNIARSNLATYPNVNLILSYSLKNEDMKTFINGDDIYQQKDLDIEYDGNDDPKAFYIKELGNNQIPENMLRYMADTPERQIVLLDSAGGVGWPEFMEFMDFANLKNKILMLDDVQHVKHHRSVNLLKQMGITFNSCATGRWGWANFTA